MTIDFASAEKISSLTVLGFGMGLVFVGLICIIALCLIMGFICKRFVKNKPATAPAAAPIGAPAVSASADIPNRGEFIAAVASVMAEELGTNVSGIRILSVKKL